MAAAKATNTAKPAGGRLPPALNPESPALTQPYKDFVQRGWISTLTVEFTPSGTQMAVVLGDAVSAKIPAAPKTAIPCGVAKQWIVDAGLWSPKGEKGTAQQQNVLPLKSLVKRDFEEKNLPNLATRAKAVAAALGDTVARGRIGSLGYMESGVDTFDKWWRVASPKHKSRLVSDDRHWKEFSDDEHRAIARALSPCPFRGNVPTPKEEEDAHQEAEA
jgi:hypothetical protein